MKGILYTIIMSVITFVLNNATYTIEVNIMYYIV